MPALILTIAVAYLAASAVLSLATIGRPRRAFGVQLSVALTLVRVGLAIAVLGVLLTVVADSAGAYPTPGATPTTHATVTTPPPVKPPAQPRRPFLCEPATTRTTAPAASLSRGKAPRKCERMQIHKREWK